MKKLLLKLMVIVLCSQLSAEIQVIKPVSKNKHSFAIVADQKTYNKTREAITAYRDAVEYDGLACYMVIENNETPETIKQAVQKIYKQEKYFEGIVLVGDIPVPMIRDAHHLSSAFKMNPARFGFERSSIASDRYYDDFGLKFDFIKQDTNNVTLYYYSLRADSPQRIEKDIYSARIKAPVKTYEKYNLIEQYLTRISQQKREHHSIKNVMTFAGHGYHSESLASWEWSLLTMKEQFPQLYTPGHSIKNLNHASSDDMKKIILAELQNPALDIALFHAHGGDDAQYLNGYPNAKNINENIRDIKLHIRSKLRQAKRWKKDPAKYQEYFQNKYGIPEDWFAGAFDDSVQRADSLYGAGLDIYSKDLKNIETQPKFVIFDECYNGQFIKKSYIAGTYLFSGGNTITTVANSVNVKQDIWANEFIGMINMGFRIGEWHKTRTYLESHLIGDPTFHFYDNLPKKLVRNLINSTNKKYWQKKLKNSNPIIRGIAVKQLFEMNKKAMIPQLVKIYKKEASYIVRLQALKCLADTRSQEFERILCVSIHDPAEMIRRITALWMSKIGNQEYLPELADRIYNDHSIRVSRQIKDGMGLIDPIKSLTSVKDAINNMPEIVDKATLEKRITRSFNRHKVWLNDELLGTLNNDTLTVKAKRSAVRTFRNYTFHNAVEPLCKSLRDKDNDLQLRVDIAEALGWFTFSKHRKTILETCDKLLLEKNLDNKIKNEIQKTKNRIVQGANNSISP